MSETNVQTPAPSEGASSGLAWLLSGFVMSVFSVGYYRSAARRRMGVAVLFFFLFALVVTILTTTNLFANLWPMARDILTGYDIPEIVIRNGTATVNGPEPVIIVNQPGQLFFAVDTTGQIDRIPAGYAQGTLLTRTELHSLQDTGDYRIFQISQLQSAFNANPIVINAQTVARAWRTFSVVFTIAAFFGLLVWHFVIRLMLFLLLGLVMWGLTSLIRPKTDFGPVLSVGLFAFVPAYYLNYLLGLASVTLPFQQMFLTVVFWAVALFLAFGNLPFLTEPRPARLWRAWVGIPMLVVFAWLLFAQLPREAMIGWVVTGVTVIALAGVSLFGEATPKSASVEPK